jgi:translocation and assembly module TamB
MERPKGIGKLLLLLLPAVLLLAVIIFIRSAYISESLNKIIIPPMEAITGKQIVAERIVLNIFPLFIEARDLAVLSENRKQILFIQRAKAYVNILSLLERKIAIRRLVIKNPEAMADNEQVNEIIGHLNTYGTGNEDKGFAPSVDVIEVREGRLHYSDRDAEVLYTISGIYGEIIISDAYAIKVNAREINIAKKGWPDLLFDVSADISGKKDSVEVKRFSLNTFGSQIRGSGDYRDGSGTFKTDINLLVSTVKRFLQLDESEYGQVNASGSVTYAGKNVLLDLELESSFYLQTLMELLEVEERTEGLVKAKGRIKGPLTGISGKGTATLENGNLFDVDVDSLACTVDYDETALKFTSCLARLYQGSAEVSASLEMPDVESFALTIAFQEVDSDPLFRLIALDLGLRNGKVAGTVYSRGEEFNPSGRFTYVHGAEDADVIGRIERLSGTYALDGFLLSLDNITFSSGLSDLTVRGRVDIDRETLDLEGRLVTKDVADLSSPYYGSLRGGGKFDGFMTGTFDDPLIHGKLRIQKPALGAYDADHVVADISYRKNQLSIHELIVNDNERSHSLKGNVYFSHAKELFDLRKPTFDIQGTLDHADCRKFLDSFYPGILCSAEVVLGFQVYGSLDKPLISGEATVEKASLYSIPVDSASVVFSYSDDTLHMNTISITRGKSMLAGAATIDDSGTFSYRAHSERMLLSHLVERTMQGDILFSFHSEGHGTIDNPAVSADITVIRGSLNEKPVGKGNVQVRIENKLLSLRGALFDERFKLDATGRIDNAMPWNAKIHMLPGRYDFLFTSLLKEVPEDFILSLKGDMQLSGDRNHISGEALVENIVISMYGHSFSSEDAIELRLNNRKLDLGTIALRSGNTFIRASGDLLIGVNYNLVLEGNSSLAPFKSFSEKIDSLKGDAEYVFSIVGDWTSPRINGGLTVSNGTFGLKDYYRRISSLEGFLYVDEDRVVLKELSGKVGGGTVDISGILYLREFSVRRFFVETKMNKIAVTMSDKFNVNFDGDMLYKGTVEEQTVSGDITINRIVYKERLDWKSWLLEAQKTDKIKTDISDFEKAELNVAVHGDQSILIDNNVARATVSADLVLKGRLYRPVLVGRLEASEGTVYFRNNNFRILRASAEFSDPVRINPIMDIASETIISGYRIRMNLEGQADQFDLALSSDPPLKEMDILALLTTGRTGEELKGLERGIGASEATSFVTGKIQDVLEERLSSLTGLDRLHVDPYVSKETGSIEPRVTVAKRLLGEKVFVTYTTTLGSAEEQIIKLEYLLSKNITLLGVRDDRGGIGGDIRLRFGFK